MTGQQPSESPDAVVAAKNIAVAITAAKNFFAA